MSTLAFELAATVRHDGQGGIADELDSTDGIARWIDRNARLVSEVLAAPFAATDVDPARIGGRLLDLRRAVRSLFAKAVSPALPSRADAHQLPDPDFAMANINRTASTLGAVQLTWVDADPATTWRGVAGKAPSTLLLGAVARSTIDFLTGPDRIRLRACPAARCVKYFVQADPRQTWCSPSCGNRERVNRHYRRTHA